jgi:hypothetical protein
MIAGIGAFAAFAAALMAVLVILGLAHRRRTAHATPTTSGTEVVLS